jgi:hypothetical protein
VGNDQVDFHLRFEGRNTGLAVEAPVHARRLTQAVHLPQHGSDAVPAGDTLGSPALTARSSRARSFRLP